MICIIINQKLIEKIMTTAQENLLKKKNILSKNGRQPQPIGNYPTSFKYYSHGEEHASLNDVFFDAWGDKILCRHIASARLLSIWRTQKRHYHKAFNRLDNIPFLRENITDNNNVFLNADEYHLFFKEKIGEQLAKIAENMVPREYLSILYYNNIHAMAITITCYEDFSIRISFYDPNDTKRHIQCLFLKPDHIKDLKLTDLLSEKDILYYFPNKSNGCFSVYKQDILQEAPPVPQFFCADNMVAKEKLNFGIWYNYSDWVKEALDSASIMLTDEDSIFDFFKCEFKDICMFNFYIKGGIKVKIIELYVDAVLNSSISIDKKIAILSPKLFSEILDTSNSEYIKLYVDKISNESHFNKQTIMKMIGRSEHIVAIMQSKDIRVKENYVNNILKLYGRSTLEYDALINVLNSCKKPSLLSHYLKNYLEKSTSSTFQLPIAYLNQRFFQPIKSIFYNYTSSEINQRNLEIR